MVVRKKNSQGCPCVACMNRTVHGREYGIDEFDTLDSGWTVLQPTIYTWSVSGGQLHCVSENLDPSVGGNLYREITPPTSANFRIRQQITIYQAADSATNGLYFVHTTNAGIQGFALFARWGFNSYGLYSYNGFQTIGTTPADGDQLKISLEDVQVTPRQVRSCFFINGVLVYSLSAVHTLPDPARCGLTATANTGSRPAAIGDYDDYGLDVDDYP